MEVLAAYSRWLYFSFNHTVCAHGLAAYLLDSRTQGQQYCAQEPITMLSLKEPHLVSPNCCCFYVDKCISCKSFLRNLNHRVETSSNTMAFRFKTDGLLVTGSHFFYSLQDLRMQPKLAF